MEMKIYLEIQDKIDECLSPLNTLMRLIIEADSEYAPLAFVVEPLLEKVNLDLYNIAGVISGVTENT